MFSFGNLRSWFVKKIYADHNDSKSVKRAIKKCLAGMPTDGNGLNIGAGDTFFDKRFKNLDIFAGPNIDIVASVHDIPLPDNSLDCVIIQEVLEHVDDPFKAVGEIARVLKPGGVFFCQLPFIIGYHPGPNDYWRFTCEGIRTLVEAKGLKIQNQGISVGPATGFYRILVEFAAIIISLPFARLYHIAKAFSALLFYPVKFLDIILENSECADKIPGGYFVVAEKVK